MVHQSAEQWASLKVDQWADHWAVLSVENSVGLKVDC